MVGWTSKEAFASIFFILYVVLVLLLLMNFLTALIVHTVGQKQELCAGVWRSRWAAFILRCVWLVAGGGGGGGGGLAQHVFDACQ